MNHKNVFWIPFALVFILGSGSAKGQSYRFSQIRKENDVLCIDFQLENLLDRDVLKGVQKGMTAAIEYQVQLWKERPHWVNQLVHEKNLRMKISYDNWEKRYLLSIRSEKAELLNEEALNEKCSVLVNFPFVPLEKLEEESKYQIAVKIVLQPMSVENYQEMKRWLTGEVSDLHPKAIQSSKSPGKKAGNWLLGLVLNLTGFGDRIVTAKSPAFVWKDGTIAFEEEN